MDEGDVDVAKRSDVDQLKGNAVGLYSILFLCVTGSAPLAVFIYNTPFTMPYGSGTNGPATFAFATIILTIFSIAYAEMIAKTRSLARELGRLPPGCKRYLSRRPRVA